MQEEAKHQNMNIVVYQRFQTKRSKRSPPASWKAHNLNGCLGQPVLHNQSWLIHPANGCMLQLHNDRDPCPESQQPQSLHVLNFVQMLVSNRSQRL